ncbi:class I lanthipeptide [Sphingobacterium sp. DR205]|uniref:class I lanthipeptide n=1 Tax=Sphingobacterium TaxID=28453 RepID=UPI0013E44280|nr:class I lanthipeptide [Sphingobacterium sp. DR205]QIH33486.1 hypothetical protein G6053_11575 [Sphingobacterium sp. DR205]
MKKNNQSNPKLTLKIQKIVYLTPKQMHNLHAGEEASVFTKPQSFNCPVPYNAPPYLTMKYCNE